MWLNGWVCDRNVMVVNYSWERYVVVRRHYCAGTGIVDSSYFTLTVRAMLRSTVDNNSVHVHISRLENYMFVTV